MTDVSLVIPTKNGAPYLERCLEGIYHQKCDYELKVIVIDSGSTDGTLDIARRYGATVRVIPPNRFTHGRARNLGVSIFKCRYLVFCNQDVVPANEHWLQALVQPLEQPIIGAAYSRQIAPPDTALHERLFLQRHYPPLSRINTCKMLTQRGPMEMVLFSTVSGAMKREVWERYRFNEKIVISEDQEIACRILMSGYVIIYAANSVVYHANKYTLLTAFQRYFDSGWSLSNTPLLRVSSLSKSISYVTSYSAEILRERSCKISERFLGLGYLFAKVAGFTLGQLAPYMPDNMRTRLSYTRNLIGV
ncbi:MAG: glycosyltransferase [Nitrososphaerales archaeon]